MPGWVVSCLPPSVRPVIAGLTASFFVKGTFRLHPGAPAGPGEEPPETPNGDLPYDGDPALGLGYASDFVPYKPKAEFLVVGTACNPIPGRGSFPVKVRVGSKTKEIVVIGDREWKGSLLGSQPGPPGPVDRVALSYANSWGGASYPRNPLGRGRDGSRLPNLELAAAPVLTRASQIEPAGFAPLPAAWPQRSGNLGTYDAEWLRSRWPWYPVDFDPRHFNAAPSGQWFDNYLVGDEDLEFVNLHPSHPVYRSRLPGLRVRCFVTQQEEKQPAFREVPLVLDTVWMDLDREKLVLVWRGRTPIRHLKMRDVATLLVLTEPLDQPARTLAECAEIHQKELAGPVREAAPMPDPKKMQAEMDAAMASIETKTAAMKAEFARAEAEANKVRDTAMATGEARARDGLKPTPPVTDPDIFNKVAAGATEKNAAGATFAEAGQEFQKASAEAAEFDAKFEAARKEIHAQFPGGAPPPSPPPKDAKIDPGAAATAGFAGMMLEGHDFSGWDLRGICFDGAMLTGVNFAAAKLTGASFQGAVFTTCNLAGAVCAGAVFDRARFVECDLAKTSWRGAALANAQFSGHNLAGCDFGGVVANGAAFRRAVLTGAKFGAAELRKAAFDGAEAGGVDFSGACLEDASFFGTVARKAVFTGGNLTRCRAVAGADFSQADLRRIHAPGSIWKGGIFDGANFQQAVLTRAQFSETSLRGTCLDRCELAEATFEDAIMTEAALTRANLLRCLFDRADLTRARLDGSNLYESSFWETILLHAQWPQANIRRTSLAGGGRS